MRSAGRLVSVILPVRDGARYLAEALDSVRAQTYQPYELIAVDGGSTDGSVAILESYQPDRLIQQQQPGLWAAFNLGIRAAAGEYVAFVGSDDRWTPDKITRQAAYLDQHSEAQAVIGQTVFFVADGHPSPRGFRPRLIGAAHAFRQLEALMARRSLFAANGLLTEDLVFAADTDWFARAQDAGVTVAALPGVLLYKRLHDRNYSLSAPSEQKRDLLGIVRQSLARKREQSRLGPADLADESISSK